SPSSGSGQRAKEEEEEDVGVEGGREGFLRWEGRDGEDTADGELVFMGSNGSLSMGWGDGKGRVGVRRRKTTMFYMTISWVGFVAKWADGGGRESLN
ncbi:hypothetical protein B296_00047932, partial [Ensete ventricosum]